MFQRCTCLALRTGVILLLILLGMSCATPPADPDQEVRPDDAPPDRVEEPDRQDQYDLVVQALRSGRAREAGAILDDIGAPPEVPELWLAYGHLLLADGEFSAADRVYRAVAEHDTPVQADALYALALTTDNEASAESYLREVLELEPEHTGAGSALGTLALDGGRTEEAEQYFERVLQQNEEHFESLVGMARIYLDRPPRRVALGYVDRALAVDPDAGFVHAERGRILSILRRTDEAIEAYRRAIELEPDTPWHYYDLGRVLQNAGRHEDALARFDEALALEDEVFLFFFHRANSLYALGRYAEADAGYARVLSAQPDYRDAFGLYAATAFLTGDFGRAARYFERTYDEVTRVPSFAMLTGIALRQDGRREESRAWFEQVRRLAGTESLYSQIAVEYQNPRNDDLTIRRIQNERDPSVRARMSFYLGALYSLIDRPALAEALLEAARVPEIEGSIEFELAGWFLDTYGQGHAR
ncbi:MAG: tetratricopeptide repeat protein [bacterium]